VRSLLKFVQVTKTDQVTLEQGEEPLRTLKRFRQGPHLGLTSRSVFFGSPPPAPPNRRS